MPPASGSRQPGLKRRGTDRLDLYPLHWRGPVPLAEPVEAMEQLVAAGKIRRGGVRHLDTADLREQVAAGGAACATDQVRYNLTRRGPEYDPLPGLASRGMPLMAYHPIGQGRLPGHPNLRGVAAGRSATPAQVALGWVLRQEQVMVLPKAGSVAHGQENRAAAALPLSASDLAVLDAAFSCPSKRRPPGML